MNQQETIARIEDETRKFAAEQRASTETDARTFWPFPVGGMLVGAALFGAGMAFAKLIGV